MLAAAHEAVRGLVSDAQQTVAAEATAAHLLSRHKQTKKPSSSPEKKAKSLSVHWGLQQPPLFGGGGGAPLDKPKRPLPEARLDKRQQEQIQALQRNSIQTIADKVQSLEHRQDSQLERTSALEARLAAIKQELQDFRSRSSSITSGGGRSVSPRGDRSGSSHDDWQVVLGGWREA